MSGYLSKSCVVCNSTFWPISGSQKVCGQSCRKKLDVIKTMRNRDKIKYRDYMRTYRAKNIDTVRAQDRARYRDDPRVNAQKKAAAAKRHLGGIDRQEIFDRDGYICLYCGDTDGPFHIDHMTPLVRGGKNIRENLTVACQNCNLRKHTLTAKEFQNV